MTKNFKKQIGKKKNEIDLDDRSFIPEHVIDDTDKFELCDHPESKPIYVTSDGRIFLETFNPNSKDAVDFLIAIAEPISRPKYIQEYKITQDSLCSAASQRFTAQIIISYLNYYNKFTQISPILKKRIRKYIRHADRLKLVLSNRNYYIESKDEKLLDRFCQDSNVRKHINKEILDHPEPPYQKVDLNDNYLVKIDMNARAFISGVGFSEDASGLSKFKNPKADPENSSESEIEDDEENQKRVEMLDREEEQLRFRCFPIKGDGYEVIRQKARDKGYPLFNEYDYHNDTSIASFSTFSPKITTVIRPYQENALGCMFSGGNSKSGIIVLPCGAGKTLVGIIAMATVGRSSFVLCNAAYPVYQWRDQLLKWTNIPSDSIIPLTSKEKKKLPPPSKPCIVITTYSMITSNSNHTDLTKDIIDQIRSRPWGLLVLDEVQESVAKTFRKALELIKAHSRLGLTATLCREDDKIGDLNYLIGPKLYEANWMDLSNQGFLAKVKCYEVWCTMTKKFYNEYLNQNDARKKKLISVYNPNKIMTCERLIRYHLQKNDKILVFCDSIPPLKYYSEKIEENLDGVCISYEIDGDTPEPDRARIFGKFKTDMKTNLIFLSQIGDKAIDLPDANVLIQVDFHGGGRTQEAQRLGRILRSKGVNNDEYNAFFYSLISADTKELMYGEKRQQFLINQGYSYEIVQKPEEKWKDVSFEQMKNNFLFMQDEILKECIESNKERMYDDDDE